jgi:hypothetical protein
MKSSQFFFVKLFLFSITTTILILCFVEKLSNDKLTLKSNSTICGRFPSEQDITLDNTIWQVLEISRGFVKLMNAYLDERQNQTVVRINANSIPLNISQDNIYCQFWFDDETQPLIVKASEYALMWSTYS